MTAPRNITLAAVSPLGTSLPGIGLVEDAKVSRSGVGTSGSGGWQIVDRPRRGATIEWIDYSPLSMELDLILDGWDVGPVVNVGGASVSSTAVTPVSVEPPIAVIESWELPAPGSIQPPVLAVTGPVPHNELQWVLYELDWGAAIRDPVYGFRTQQAFHMTLLEYVAAQISLTPVSPAAAAQAAQTSLPPAPIPGVGPGSAAGGSTGVNSLPATDPSAPGGGGVAGAFTTTYIVQAGDTLSSIAAKVYGNYLMWVGIAQLNGIRDPNSIYPGEVLQMPPQSTFPPTSGVSGTNQAILTGQT